MDEVLHTEEVVFAKGGFDDTVIRNRNALLVHFAIATLVNELSNRLEIWFPRRLISRQTKKVAQALTRM